MKRINHYLLTLLGASLILTTSCKKEEESVKDFSAYAGNDTYVVGLRVSAGGTATADYILKDDSMHNGTITAVGVGVEQQGWCYYASVGKKMLSFSYSGNTCNVYELNSEGTPQKTGSFAFERVDAYAKADDNTLVAFGAPWGGGTLNTELMVIDVNRAIVTNSVVTPIYTIPGVTADTLNKWPTGIVVRDNKLFVSFYPLDGATWETPIMDTAYVSIYSYPGLSLLKTIKDTRTSPIGYYANQPCMMVDENEDIYTISSNSFSAGFTETGKPSGILRIKSGEEVFDPTYFFDFEAASGGKKLLLAVYVGGGKAVGRVISHTETADDVWAAFDIANSICDFVVIDLVNKTVTDVTGVPTHGGQYATPYLVENGKVIFSVTDATGGTANLYYIDPASATGTIGAEIVGQEVSIIKKIDQ